VSNLDELEVKTLKFQNQKLGLRLTQRLAIEEDLKLRIDQLEKRQTQDDAVINVIHRYWNQLNEDMRILLQRFDAETGDEEEKNEESEATTSFLTQLATWHKQELDEKLASRVQVSQRAVGKIIQVFDHVIQRNERLSKAFRGDAKLTETPNGDVTDTSIDKSDVESAESKTDSKSVKDKVLDETSSKKDKGKEKAETEITATGNSSKKSAATGNSESTSASENSISDSNKACPISCLDDQVKDWNSQLVKENKNLHRLNTSLHERNHFLSLKQAEFEELINAEQTKNEEL
jgi:E3 ubiquitin-protein ligase BRE1